MQQALGHVEVADRSIICASLAGALFQAGKRQESTTQLKSAYDQYANLDSANTRQEFFLATARAEFEIGNYLKALNQLSRAFEGGLKETGYVPHLAEARLLRGICYAKLGEIDLAREQWIEVSPLISSLPFLQDKETELNQLIGNKPDNSRVGQKWALLIGVSRFKDSGISKLRYASKDAKDLQQFLVQKLLFSSDHVHTLTDEQATRQNILDELGGCLRS